MKILTYLILTFSLLTTACSYAIEKPQKYSSNKQAYTWQVKDKTFTVWLQSDLFAELNSDDTNDSVTTEKQANTLDGLVIDNPSLRIWRFNETAISSKSENTRVPVFSDTPDGKSLRVLIGGIIVVLDPTLSTSAAEDWLEQRELNGKRLAIANNAFFVDTLPGFPSLELVNALTAENDAALIFAEPNWWQESSWR